MWCGLGVSPLPATPGYPPDSPTPGYSPDSDSSEPKCSLPRWISIGGDMAFPGPRCDTTGTPVLGRGPDGPPSGVTWPFQVHAVVRAWVWPRWISIWGVMACSGPCCGTTSSVCTLFSGSLTLALTSWPRPSLLHSRHHRPIRSNDNTEYGHRNARGSGVTWVHPPASSRFVKIEIRTRA